MQRGREGIKTLVMEAAVQPTTHTICSFVYTSLPARVHAESLVWFEAPDLHCTLEC